MNTGVSLALSTIVFVSLLVCAAPTGVAVFQQEREYVRYAEVTLAYANGTQTSLYCKIAGNSISVYIPSGVTWVEVRVDSFCSVKPAKVYLNGEEVQPVGGRLVVMGDFAWVNVSEVGSGTLRVVFKQAARMPVAYAIRLGRTVRCYGEKMNITVPSSGEWKGWGALVYALVFDRSDIVKMVRESRFTILSLNKTELTIGSYKMQAYRVLYLVSEPNFTLYIGRNIADVQYLYYAALSARDGSFTAKFPGVLVEAQYVYVNLPSYAKFRVAGAEWKFVGLRLPIPNPLVAPAANASDIGYSLDHYTVRVEIPKGAWRWANALTVLVEPGHTSFQGVEARVAATAFSPVNITVYGLQGQAVGTYTVDSFAPLVTLRARLYRLVVKLLTATGSPLPAANVTLYHILSRYEYRVNGSTLDAGYVPAGEYLLTVYVRGVEVARKTLYVNDNSVFVVQCNVVNLRARVVKQDGEPLENFTLILRGPVTFTARGKNGVAQIGYVPLGSYTAEVKVGSISLAQQKVSITTSSLYLVVPACELIVKALSAMGTPLSGASVEVYANGTLMYSGVTDPMGKVDVKYLRPGEYTVKVSVGGFEYTRSVRLSASTGIVRVKTEVAMVIDGFVLKYGEAVFVAVLIMLGILACLARVLARRKVKKRRKIVIKG